MKRTALPIIVYLLASFFYLYEFALQVAPSVMVKELMYTMQIDSVGLSWLAAAYYYAYAPMQIPAGILFDKFGPRKLISFAIILCVTGTFLFAHANSLYWAALGRFFVGIGSAFSFVGILILISNWFHDKYYACLIGVAQLLSSVGVISGQYILAYYTSRHGWRESLIFIAYFGIVLAVLTWLIVRDKPENTQKKHFDNDLAPIALSTLLTAFFNICKMPQTWFIAAYAFFIWGPMTFFSSLWAVEYIKIRYAFSISDSISYQMYLWLGVAIGCPLLGAFSNMIQRRILPMLLAALLGLVAALIMLSDLNLSPLVISILFLLMGISAAGQTVSFGLVKDIQPAKYLGSASGFNNMATVAGGAVLQPIMGSLIKYYWTGEVLNGVPVYNLYTFQKALILLPICYIIALILTVFFIKESYCQSMDK